MIQTVIRVAKRFAILVPGVIIAYFSVRNIFPYFDQHVPLALAILMTYALAAYVLIPALTRLFRIFFPANHLPLYCVTPDGLASDPLNVGLIGTRDQVISALEQAGWYIADPHSFRNVTRQILSAIFGWSYPSAPLSHLYLFGRKQDLGFEIPLEGVGGGKRHHVRFWATTYEEKKRLTVKNIRWHHRREHIKGDKLLWVGAASLDTGIAPIKHNLQITHMIHPDTDQERELIIEQLESENLISKKHNLKLGNPYKLSNRALRGYLSTDGKMTVAHLKTRKQKA